MGAPPRYLMPRAAARLEELVEEIHFDQTAWLLFGVMAACVMDNKSRTMMMVKRNVVLENEFQM